MSMTTFIFQFRPARCLRHPTTHPLFHLSSLFLPIRLLSGLSDTDIFPCFLPRYAFFRCFQTGYLIALKKNTYVENDRGTAPLNQFAAPHPLGQSPLLSNFLSYRASPAWHLFFWDEPSRPGNLPRPRILPSPPFLLTKRSSSLLIRLTSITTH